MLAPRTAIAGHRGASGLVRHENTVEAIRRTATAGATWVEVDVRQLGDGTLVLMHDPSFDGRPLRTMSLTELRERAALRSLAVPTLDEALEACGAAGLHVDLELKEPGTEAAVVRAARARLPGARILYTSFDDGTVAALKGLHPEARTGLLLGRPSPTSSLRERLTELYPTDRLRACQADVAVPHWRLVQLGVLPRLRAAGYPVWVWTVNRAACLRWLLDLQVDGLITDFPDVAVALRDGRSSPQGALLTA